MNYITYYKALIVEDKAGGRKNGIPKLITDSDDAMIELYREEVSR